MMAVVIRRPARPRVVVAVAPPRAPEVSVPKVRGWSRLHNEIVGEMRQLGADPRPLYVGGRG